MDTNNESVGRITLRDVAKKAGISHVTVSLALRNQGRISPKRRREIQKLAQEMGYRPEPMARALAQYRQSNRTIPVHSSLAWVNNWPDPKALRRHKEFDAYWTGAQATAEKNGFYLEEFIVSDNFNPQRLETILLTRNVRGILIPPQQIPIDWGNFHWEEFSVIRFGHSILQPAAYKITADQTGNALRAFDSMTQLGYQRIGFIGLHAHTRLHTAGFLMAQLSAPKANRIPLCCFTEHDDHSFGVLQSKIAVWLKKNRPDAILTDFPAVPVILKELGYRVPKDIGLATLSTTDGNLDTGIYQNPELIGKAAAEVLIALINRGERGIPPVWRTTLVPGTWVNGPTLPPKNKSRR